MHGKLASYNKHYLDKVITYYLLALTSCLKYIIGLNNQRTNGPVNAHLRPEIYTNKLV